MKKIVAYLFNHNHYNEVISSYNEIQTQYNKGYKVWCKYNSVIVKSGFNFKEYVVSYSDIIKEIALWIQTAERLISEKRKAVAWFFYEQGKSSIPQLGYEEYKSLYQNEKQIATLNGYIATYDLLWTNYNQAVKWFLPQIGQEPTYEEIKEVASAKETIIKIDHNLKKGRYFSQKYKQAWSLFTNDEKLDSTSIVKLSSLTEENFSTKEKFIQIFSTKKNRVLLILGVTDYPINLFGTETLEKEKFILDYFSTELNIPEAISFECSINDEIERKRTVLGSIRYGKDVNFVDTFPLDSFYNLRSQFDDIGVNFDKAIDFVKENRDAIKSYNHEKSGKETVFIENYIQAVKEGTELNKYIQNYQYVKRQRAKAKQIADSYPLGYEFLFKTTDVNSCSLIILDKIINSKSSIQEQEERFRALQKAKEEAERKKKEQDFLLSCVSSWDCLNCGLKYSYLLNYYPTTCTFEATQSEWDDRWTVWNFKNSPGKTSEIEHQEALDDVIPRLKEKLTATFGKINLPKLTLVCIPAANQENTQRRYEEFSKRLCHETGLINSYGKIKVIHERSARHTGGTGLQTEFLSFDENFFKDRYVILFDDVITRGDSMCTFRRKMENMGAIVIAGLSIGKTKHERPNSSNSFHSLFIDDNLPF